MESFFSSTANCLVRWQDLPGNGTPMIFVHGLGCASSYEYPRIVTDPLFNKRHAILLDLPGCGYSGKPRDYSYSITDQAIVVAELVHHLGLNKCFIYGHSMGGSISIEAAGLITDRLEGLVVSEPNFRPGGGFFSREICSHSEEEFINRHWQRMIENESGPWAGSLAADAPWAVWRGAASLIAGGDWLERFIKLPVRKQLIFGARSLPDEDVDYLVNSGSGVSTAILDDCGHCMSWEQPGSLSLALSNFASK